MRTLVALRHAEREPGGAHLTDRGVRSAAETGRLLARFDRVLASPKPRAAETAEAMGYRIDAELAELEGLPEPIERRVGRELPRSFADYVALVGSVGEARAYAERLATLWRDEMERLADGARLLVVSHGGVIELGAVGALGGRTRRWGPLLGLLEGVEVARDASGWIGGKVLRRRG
jgi:broad specificity phosphatase PhoE